MLEKTNEVGGRIIKNADTGHSFAAYFKRATSPMVVLSQLLGGPMYVYEISQALKKKSNNQFTISVLYPVLYKLEEQGYVKVAGTEVESNRVRNYYEITQDGERYLTELQGQYRNMVEVVNSLLNSTKGGDAE